MLRPALWFLKFSVANKSSSSSLEGHLLRVSHNQNWQRVYLLLPKLLHYSDKILAMMMLIQHWVSSSKTVGPCALCDAQCILEHGVRT